MSEVPLLLPNPARDALLNPHSETRNHETMGAQPETGFQVETHGFVVLGSSTRYPKPDTMLPKPSTSHPGFEGRVWVWGLSVGLGCRVGRVWV